jgi:hypothetical protein
MPLHTQLPPPGKVYVGPPVRITAEAFEAKPSIARTANAATPLIIHPLDARRANRAKPGTAAVPLAEFPTHGRMIVMIVPPVGLALRRCLHQVPYQDPCEP